MKDKKTIIQILTILILLGLILLIKLNSTRLLEGFYQTSSRTIPWSSIKGMRIGPGFTSLRGLLGIQVDYITVDGNTITSSGNYFTNLVSSITDLQNNIIWQNGQPIPSLSMTNYPEGVYVFFKPIPVYELDVVSSRSPIEIQITKPDLRHIPPTKFTLPTNRPTYIFPFFPYLTGIFNNNPTADILRDLMARYNYTYNSFKRNSIDFLYFFDDRKDQTGNYYDILLDSPPSSSLASTANPPQSLGLTGLYNRTTFETPDKMVRPIGARYMGGFYGAFGNNPGYFSSFKRITDLNGIEIWNNSFDVDWWGYLPEPVTNCLFYFVDTNINNISLSQLQTKHSDFSFMGIDTIYFFDSRTDPTTGLPFNIFDESPPGIFSSMTTPMTKALPDIPSIPTTNVTDTTTTTGPSADVIPTAPTNTGLRGKNNRTTFTNSDKTVIPIGVQLSGAVQNGLTNISVQVFRDYPTYISKITDLTGKELWNSSQGAGGFNALPPGDSTLLVFFAKGLDRTGANSANTYTLDSLIEYWNQNDWGFYSRDKINVEYYFDSRVDPNTGLPFNIFDETPAVVPKPSTTTGSVKPTPTPAEKVNQAVSTATLVGGTTLVVGTTVVGTAAALGVAPLAPLIFTFLLPVTGVVALGAGVFKFIF